MSIAWLRLTTRRAMVERSPAARRVYRSSLVLRTAKRVSSLSGQGCSGASPYQVLAIFDLSVSFAILAHVAELADAYGSGPYGATRGGSSPLVSIN